MMMIVMMMMMKKKKKMAAYRARGLIAFDLNQYISARNVQQKL
jgi:hypothetical protein